MLQADEQVARCVATLEGALECLRIELFCGGAAHLQRILALRAQRTALVGDEAASFERQIRLESAAVFPCSLEALGETWGTVANLDSHRPQSTPVVQDLLGVWYLLLGAKPSPDHVEGRTLGARMSDILRLALLTIRSWQ